MELIYLSYNQSFTSKNEITFSTNLTFREELLTFVIEENKNIKFDSNFFGKEILSITAFIGKNGIGKTSNICKPIMASNWLFYNFLVFKKESELLVFKNPSKKSTSIDNKTKYKHKEITITDLGPNDILEDINSQTNEELKNFIRIYFSTAYSESPLTTKSIHDDISTSGLIAKELSLIKGEEKPYNKESKVQTKDSFTNFKFNELKNQISFLESKIGKEMTSELKMNTKIKVSHFPKNRQFNYNHFENLELFKEFEKISSKKIENGLIDITKSPPAPRIVIIVWSLVCNLGIQVQEEFINFLNRKKVSFYDNKIELDEDDVNLNVFIGSLIKLLNNTIDHVEEHYIIKMENYFVFSNTTFSIPFQIGNKFIEIFSKHLRDKITNYVFQWNISAGEYSFLSLFSRLYSSKYRAFENHYLLVLDEGDSNFHPEWSRKYMKLLIDWIPKILFRAKSIQLVLTTHSPYVLSDLPSQNVYTLKIENGNLKIEHPTNLTFGANIHDLLANEFFLEDGFMGEFAKGKIQTVIDLLNEKDTEIINSINQKELWDTINMIGEEFLKQKLKSMFLSKFENPEYLKQELSKARAEVLRLENLNRKG